MRQFNSLKHHPEGLGFHLADAQAPQVKLLDLPWDMLNASVRR